jgi:dTDP-4-dehydrorhamnose reductase
MEKKTILIFGISSFLGSNLAAILKKKYRVVGTYYKTPVNIPGILTLKCDIHSKDLVQKVVYLLKPDITIYAVGLSHLNSCQEFPKVADALNTAGVFNASMASERYKSKFVYFSSSYIFSGENILYKENDTPTPTSIYGSTIASAEFYIQKSCLNYLIFRCCPLIGRSYNPFDLKWMERVEQHSFENKSLSCDNKVKTGFIDFHTLATLFDYAIKNNFTNRLFQVCTKDVMSRYEFAQTYLDLFGGNSSILNKSDWSFPQTENLRAVQNLTEELVFQLDTSNIESAFSIKMPTIVESLGSIKNELKGRVKTRSSLNKSTGITFI